MLPGFSTCADSQPGVNNDAFEYSDSPDVLGLGFSVIEKNGPGPGAFPLPAATFSSEIGIVGRTELPASIELPLLDLGDSTLCQYGLSEVTDWETWNALFSFGGVPRSDNTFDFDSAASASYPASELSSAVPNIVEVPSSSPYYACPRCSQAFASPQELDTHVKGRDQRPYVCREPGCHKRYNRQDCLARHSVKHRASNPHSCGDCALRGVRRTFTRMDHLKQHRKKCHSDSATLSDSGDNGDHSLYVRVIRDDQLRCAVVRELIRVKSAKRSAVHGVAYA